MICAIVTADRNWAIGKNGKKLTNIPDDIRYLREVGHGQNIIMGRKTYESIGDMQLLNDRTNIVLTRKTNLLIKGAVVANSPEEAVRYCQEKGGDVYIIGGSSVFAEMLSYCDEIQVTWIDYSYDADSYFPDLDKDPEWVLVEESEEQTHFDTIYYFRKYNRRKYYAGRL